MTPNDKKMKIPYLNLWQIKSSIHNLAFLVGWIVETGVTTENGKNSTLSDLVFVKVIDN